MYRLDTVPRHLESIRGGEGAEIQLCLVQGYIMLGRDTFSFTLRYLPFVCLHTGST